MVSESVLVWHSKGILLFCNLATTQNFRKDGLSNLCRHTWLPELLSAPEVKYKLYTINSLHVCTSLNEPRHDKTNKMSMRPPKTQMSLGIRPVWSESSLSAWRNLGSLATHWAHSEDSDQTGRMPRLIWVFAGRTVTLLVLSCRGSNVHNRGAYTFSLKSINWRHLS